MRYTTLLFDVDHTLFDFDASEAAAFDATLGAFGIGDASRYVSTFHDINKRLWNQVEQNALSPNDVRVMRFAQLIKTEGLAADAAEMSDRYVVELGAHGDLLPGARELLDALDGQVSMAIVSNGIGEVQRAKLQRLDLERYFDAIAISGEIGVSKPAPDIFDFTFETLGFPDKATAVMIGDRLASDIRGGVDYGIDTCWVTDTASEPSSLPTHTVHDLGSVLAMVHGSGTR